jgi:hypothetical protein
MILVLETWTGKIRKSHPEELGNEEIGSCNRTEKITTDEKYPSVITSRSKKSEIDETRILRTLVVEIGKPKIKSAQKMENRTDE